MRVIEGGDGNVVPIHTRHVSDVPASLRDLADRIERGDQEASTCIVITTGGASPSGTFVYGDYPGEFYLIGVMTAAAHSMPSSVYAAVEEDPS